MGVNRMRESAQRRRARGGGVVESFEVVSLTASGMAPAAALSREPQGAGMRGHGPRRRLAQGCTRQERS